MLGSQTFIYNVFKFAVSSSLTHSVRQCLKCFGFLHNYPQLSLIRGGAQVSFRALMPAVPHYTLVFLIQDALNEQNNC